MIRLDSASFDDTSFNISSWANRAARTRSSSARACDDDEGVVVVMMVRW